MAKKAKRLSIHLTDREQIRAIIYMLFSFFMLPWLLSELNGFLPAPMGNVWLNFLYYAINFLAIGWIFGSFFKRSLIYAGQNMGDFLIAVLIGSACYWLSSWGITRLLEIFFPAYVNLNDGSISAMAGSNFTLVFIGTVILVPLAEEALHRGLIFGCLYPKNHVAAYALSVCIFAAVHILGYVGTYSTLHLALAFLQYVPAGLCLAWVYRKSGSIFAPILLHTVNNAVGMFAQR